MRTKTVKDSRVTIVHQMTQADANLAGNVHGGVIMKLIDNTAGIVAARHCQTNVVTASIDRLDFHNPVFIGDLLRVTASINMTGRSSIEVGVRVESENFMTQDIRHTASAYLTFVSLDENLRPNPVPPIVYETEEEQRRNCEARERKAFRLQQRGKAKACVPPS